jgi:hypothetical protein
MKWSISSFMVPAASPSYSSQSYKLQQIPTFNQETLKRPSKHDLGARHVRLAITFAITCECGSLATVACGHLLGAMSSYAHAMRLS